MNWAIIVMMVTLVGMFGHLALTFFDHEPATDTSKLPAGMTAEQVEGDGGLYNAGSYATSN